MMMSFTHVDTQTVVPYQVVSWFESVVRRTVRSHPQAPAFEPVRTVPAAGASLMNNNTRVEQKLSVYRVVYWKNTPLHFNLKAFRIAGLKDDV